jgi:hypothetical protein
VIAHFFSQKLTSKPFRVYLRCRGLIQAADRKPVTRTISKTGKGSPEIRRRLGGIDKEKTLFAVTLEVGVSTSPELAVDLTDL